MGVGGGRFPQSQQQLEKSTKTFSLCKPYRVIKNCENFLLIAEYKGFDSWNVSLPNLKTQNPRKGGGEISLFPPYIEIFYLISEIKYINNIA